MVLGCFKCLGGGPSNREEQQQPQQPQIPPQPLLIEDVPDDIQNFTFEELNLATDGFSHSLGEGGFAGVFRGTLLDGRVVAVKRAQMHKIHGRESFLAEMNCLKLVQLRHANIIRLIGYHATVDEMILVLEYMQLGSLYSHTHDRQRSGQNLLDWNTRLNVAKGTARDLEFLHSQNVLHRDLKPENILLDEAFVPKVSDFGLGMLVADSSSFTIIESRGHTFGYTDPWCFDIERVSDKSDVYSFGVVLLELLTGRKALVGTTSLVKEARAVGFQGLVDPDLIEAPQNQIAECLEIANICVQYDPVQRPTMAAIVQRLSLL